MIDLQTRPHTIVENWEKMRGVLGAHGPAALQEFRDTNFAAFRSVGFPTLRDEEFKYISLRTLNETRFEPAYGATVMRSQIEHLPLGNLEAITVAFINGQFAPELSTLQVLPNDMFVGTFEEAFEAHEETVLQHFGKIGSLEGKLGTTNDERFVHLNGGYFSEGAVIIVPRGLAFEQPIHLLYISSAEHGHFASFPRNLVLIGEGAEAKIVESYIGLTGEYWTNAVTEVNVAARAHVEHTMFQNEAEGATHFKSIYVNQGADSVYTSNNANFGGSIVRNDLNVWLDGEHTETWLNGANVGAGNQVIDNHTRLDHAKPNCNSFEVYKSILDDRSTGIFNGKIFVYEDAQKTDAKQTNQGILLSPNATFNTKPQLEIFADDVKCTHGATIGQLREDAMFYLQARGIPQKEARALLVYAFAAEVLEKISIEPVKDELEKLLFEKLSVSSR